MRCPLPVLAGSALHVWFANGKVVVVPIAVVN